MSKSHVITQARHHTARHDETDKSMFGFWIYILTDCILFATLFATFAVLRNSTAGGPESTELFDLPFVLVETMLLLTSSFACGLAMLSAQASERRFAIRWLIITFILGAGFLGMELYEFSHLIHDGNDWQSSAFLSSFFTLVGTHGLHITAGLIWLGVLIYQLQKNSIGPVILKRVAMFSLFWHFLDIIWIFIFTIVYLLGAAG